MAIYSNYYSPGSCFGQCVGLEFLQLDHLLALVVCSKVLKTREEFVNTANLGAVDILAVRLWLDRKVHLRFYGCFTL